MKPFDLEAALRGDPVVTRDGRPVTKLQKHEEITNGYKCFTGIINDIIGTWYQDGKFERDGNHYYDLFMAPKKVTLWVNVDANDHSQNVPYVISGPYSSIDKALSYRSNSRTKTVPIEFEA